MEARGNALPSGMIPGQLPVCLSIGASSSTGGWGVQSDLKVFTALSCYGAAVVTAVSGGLHHRSAEPLHIPPRTIREQLDAAAAELPIRAVKVALLPSVDSVHLVARWLREHPELPVVVDPCAVDHHGVPHLTPEIIAAMRQELLPRATLVIPNRFEAALLSGQEECLGREDMEEAGRALLHAHGCPVLVTGGGLAEGSLDVLVALDGLRHFTGPTISAGKIQGTGGTHSSAVAAGLAKGESLGESIMAAKLYITAAIAAAPRLPNGRSVLWHAVTVREQVIVDSHSGLNGARPAAR